MINQYDVTFLCIIHENPTDHSHKARGHLGTEIMNKASCQMQIGFEKDKNQNDTNLIRVKYLKVRVGKKPDNFYLEYSQEQKGLVIADFSTVSEALESKKMKADIKEIKKRLSTLLIEPLSKQEVIDTLVRDFDCGERTIEQRIKEIYNDLHQIENSNGILCHLGKETIDRKAYFKLLPIENNEEDERPF